MNELARIWAQRQLELARRAELERLAGEVRQGFALIEPMRKAAEERRKAGLRMPGADGFVMVTL
jgi:hypothetical protein